MNSRPGFVRSLNGDDDEKMKLKTKLYENKKELSKIFAEATQTANYPQ